MLVFMMGGIMNFAFKMGLGAMIFKSSFIKIGSDVQKLLRGNEHTDTQMTM
jgi:hypothetical protein